MKKPILLLIVDDWELLERFEERFIKNYIVLCAPFGDIGVEMAQETSPHLIFLHLTFENRTNDEILAALSQDPRTKNIPVKLKVEEIPNA